MKISTTNNTPSINSTQNTKAPFVRNPRLQGGDSVSFCGTKTKKETIFEKIKQRFDAGKETKNKKKNILDFKAQEYENLAEKITKKDKSVPKSVLKKVKTLQEKDPNYAKTLETLAYSTVSLGEYFQKETAQKNLHFEHAKELAQNYVQSIREGKEVDAVEMTADFIEKKGVPRISSKEDMNRRLLGTFYEKDTKDFYNTMHDKGFFAVFERKIDSAINLADHLNPQKLDAFLKNELEYTEKLTNNESNLRSEVRHLLQKANEIGEYEIALGAVGEKFDAHGMKRGNNEQIFAQLDNLLTNGLDENRRLYTAPLDFGDDTRGFSAIFGTANGAYKDGPFVLVSQMGKTIQGDGIKYIIVNYSAQPKLKELVEKYPEYEFVKIQDTNEFFNKLAAKK